MHQNSYISLAVFTDMYTRTCTHVRVHMIFCIYDTISYSVVIVYIRSNKNILCSIILYNANCKFVSCTLIFKHLSITISLLQYIFGKFKYAWLLILYNNKENLLYNTILTQFLKNYTLRFEFSICNTY